MSKKSFEEELVDSIKQGIISNIKGTDFIHQSYENRRELPREFINSVWEQVDWSSILEKIKPQIETQICKNVLSVDGVRQKIRFTVYPELMKILNSTDI